MSPWAIAIESAGGLCSREIDSVYFLIGRPAIGGINSLTHTWRGGGFICSRSIPREVVPTTARHYTARRAS